jgi:phytanoyl-CoA hydroxylase
LKSHKYKTLSFHFCGAALHELDPAFRKVTLENQRLKDLVTDLKFHKDPVGAGSFFGFAAQ